MSNNRYLEFDSTYRNRNEWPLPGEFQIPISQSGRKSKDDALDPVSVSVPIKTWTSNNLNNASGSSLTGTIAPTTPPISVSSDSRCFIIQTAYGQLQQKKDYYLNLVIKNTNPSGPSTSTVDRYSYLYSTGPYDYGQIITSGAKFTPGDPFIISDPTDVTSATNPYFFVPFGELQKNAYIRYLLYNETLIQSRKITTYDQYLHVVSVDTTGSTSVIAGPVTGWSASHNYSIRVENPIIPIPGSAYVPIVAGPVTYIPPLPAPQITFTTSSSTIILQGVQSITPDNFYRNYSIRLISSSGPYNYPIQTPINESRIIHKSLSFVDGGNNLVLEVYPPFSSAPNITTMNAEIMNFSYDNFNPFVYTGSIVSQQEMVCYEIELLNVVLPNDTLTVGEGGRIAFYPYIYIELSNVSSPGAGLKNIIYSNNPNSTKVIFRAVIDDTSDPIITAFTKLDGDGMVQTIKFKPNDNLFFSVRLGNGDVYNTVISDNLSPALPNPLAQISALFSLRRL